MDKVDPVFARPELFAAAVVDELAVLLQLGKRSA